jgi:Tol biopolymer transport system component
MRVAKYGDTFETSEVKDIDLGDDVYVGLFVGSHNADVLETGVFNNVRVTVPAWDSLRPYRDYLGSRLEVLDVATGTREVLYTSPKSLQAPNWTTDGKNLVYNSEGLIYTFDIEKRKPEVLNTGDVKNNNNDHVLSFDGKMLGLSSGVQKLGGSIVYTVPVTGGTPKQITPKGPSYLHGWSPDGKTLVLQDKEMMNSIYMLFHQTVVKRLGLPRLKDLMMVLNILRMEKQFISIRTAPVK